MVSGFGGWGLSVWHNLLHIRSSKVRSGLGASNIPFHKVVRLGWYL